MSRFDLFFIMLDKPDDEQLDDEIAQHIIQNHKGGVKLNEGEVTQEELKQYINAAQKKVKLLFGISFYRLSLVMKIDQNAVIVSLVFLYPPCQFSIFIKISDFALSFRSYVELVYYYYQVKIEIFEKM